MGTSTSYPTPRSGGLFNNQQSNFSAASGAALAAKDADRYLRSVNRGTRLFDWRTTLTTTGAGAATTEFCPDGSLSVYVNGDGATGGNLCTTQLAADVSTVGTTAIGIWVRVPPRLSSLKGYKSVPLKAYFAPVAGFGGGNYSLFAFSARADGKWHFYVFDTGVASNTGSWVWGTSAVGMIRVRPSVDNGISANANRGTDPLQTGEVAIFGGVWLNPRSKAAAIVRFDDCLGNLNRTAEATLAAPYVGSSGVTVAAGSYTAKQLVDAFGLVGTCFVLTRHIDTTTAFATSAELRALQSAGWDICFQTHYNPASTDAKGARLMGPNGYPRVASGSHSYVSGGTITFATAHAFVSPSGGQGTAVEFTGSPPSPLTTGVQYWARSIGASTATMHTTEADSVAGTNPITFAGDGSATFAVNQWRATTDKSGELEDMTLGKAAMQAFGFNAWDIWAPNQGAIGSSLEEAFISLGFRGMFTTDNFSSGFASGINSMLASGRSVDNDTFSVIPVTAITMSAYQTDGVGATENAARVYVQGLCRKGALGQNYHHNFTAANTLVLCAYLDELKLRQDRGEIDVVTASRMCDIVENLALS